MHANAAYAMTFTAAQFLEHSRQLMSHLVYARGRGLSVPGMLALWLVVIAIAALARDKFLWFSVWFAMLAPLPVIFVPFRGFFVMYLPIAGWAMFGAAVLVGGRNFIWAQIWKRSPLALERAVLFLVVAFLVAWVPRHFARAELRYRDPSQAVVQATESDIVGLNEPLPKGSMLLFLHDRFPPNMWGALMTCRLLYRDRTLWADTPALLGHPPTLSDYDRVFDYVDGKLTVVRSRATGEVASSSLLRPH